MNDAARIAALEQIVTRRTRSIDYIKRVQTGHARYLNLIAISEAEISSAYATDKKQPVSKRYMT